MSIRDEILAEAQEECESIRDQGCELTAGASACVEAIHQLRLVAQRAIHREPTPHKDCADRVIHVGDKVAFKHRYHNHQLTLGVVQSATTHKVRLLLDRGGETNKDPLEVCIVN